MMESTTNMYFFRGFRQQYYFGTESSPFEKIIAENRRQTQIQ